MLHYATGKGDVRSVELFIEHGVDVNVQAPPSPPDRIAFRVTDWVGGSTPLHVAVRTPFNYECTRVLLNHGADVTLKDKDGKTPLMAAEEMNRMAIARLLREHSVRPVASE